MDQLALSGSCFCGAIRFEMSGELPPLYQCHCSECRKTTGSNANAGLLILRENFTWLAGAECIKTYLKDSGFRINFCPTCSSPVPNVVSQLPTMMWIPVGLIDGDLPSTVQHHIHVSSKANWDVICGAAQQHAELPADLRVLLPKQ